MGLNSGWTTEPIAYDTIELMSVPRRYFIAVAPALAAVIQPPGAPAAPLDSQRDPLGVRPDFPVVDHRIYLNSAYIAPVHRAVIAAAQAHLEANSKGSLD